MTPTAGGATSPAVLDLVRQPRNVGLLDREEASVGVGAAGTVARGGVVRISIRVGGTGRIEEAKFQAYGCPSAIASASFAATLVRGMRPVAARRLTAGRIARALELPPGKLYCAELAADALGAAVEDHGRKTREARGHEPAGMKTAANGSNRKGFPA